MAAQMNRPQAISNLQRYLRQISYFDSDIPPVPIDGIYESETRNAVSRFQQKYRLPVTGTVNRETWDKIYTVYRASVEDNSPPGMISPFPRKPDGYSAGAGDRWFLIDILQYMLREISESYDGTDIERTGIFDSDTELAVRAFQRAHRLEQTGRVDRKTWNALSAAYNRTVADYSV